MGIGNNNSLALVILSFLLCICFTSCIKTTQEKETSLANVSVTAPSSKLLTQKHTAVSKNDILHTLRSLEERTAWNIEVSFVKVAKNGFIIRICDNDNQGFSYNPIYFVLAYYNGEEWVKLTTLQESLSNTDLVFVFPDEDDEYVDTNNLNMFSLIPDFELKPGKYRITKVLSGKEFSAEFVISEQQ